MKRAERRHHYYRIKKNRRYYYGNTEQDIQQYNIMCAVRVNHCPDCSCAMCGNPRRHFKYKTRSELKAMLSYIEQCEACNIRTTLTRNQIQTHSW